MDKTCLSNEITTKAPLSKVFAEMLIFNYGSAAQLCRLTSPELFRQAFLSNDAVLPYLSSLLDEAAKKLFPLILPAFQKFCARKNGEVYHPAVFTSYSVQLPSISAASRSVSPAGASSRKPFSVSPASNHCPSTAKYTRASSGSSNEKPPS